MKALFNPKTTVFESFFIMNRKISNFCYKIFEILVFQQKKTPFSNAVWKGCKSVI